ncbi:hypothetical protein HPB51_029306 [Rhipicephalus microplus]|uniref:PiggyBac transposable element-derived protein domain-containing protein n=1 Tax=Rhipicephalus microplus TaxID=6941 RepID=A0A9J6CUG0_RHIMP|nr:hypothetical protein HPB51_029306 [Rhipicephalus microplus]
MDLVADSMSVDRFSEIRRFLHFKDKSDTLSFQNDRVAGMRPFIDALNEAFCSAVDPEEYQFVAEMAIPLKGRSSTEQYLPTDNITVTRWLDNSLVHVVSSYTGRQPEGTTKRYNRKERKVMDVTRLYSVELYNKHIGGVDLVDSLISRYRKDVRNKRGYLKIFFHLLNAAVVNAWIVWRWDKGVEHPMNQLEFRSRVAKALIFRGETAQSSKRRGRPSNDSPTAPINKRVFNHVSLEKRLGWRASFPKEERTKVRQPLSKPCLPQQDKVPLWSVQRASVS